MWVNMDFTQKKVIISISKYFHILKSVILVILISLPSLMLAQYTPAYTNDPACDTSDKDRAKCDYDKPAKVTVEAPSRSSKDNNNSNDIHGEWHRGIDKEPDVDHFNPGNSKNEIDKQFEEYVQQRTRDFWIRNGEKWEKIKLKAGKVTLSEVLKKLKAIGPSAIRSLDFIYPDEIALDAHEKLKLQWDVETFTKEVDFVTLGQVYYYEANFEERNALDKLWNSGKYEQLNKMSHEILEFRKTEKDIKEKKEVQKRLREIKIQQDKAEIKVRKTLINKNPFLAEMTFAFLNEKEISSITNNPLLTNLEIQQRVMDLYLDTYLKFTDLNWDKIENEISLTVNEKENLLRYLRMNKLQQADRYINQLFSQKTAKVTTKKQNCLRRGGPPPDLKDNFFTN